MLYLKMNDNGETQPTDNVNEQGATKEGTGKDRIALVYNSIVVEFVRERMDHDLILLQVNNDEDEVGPPKKTVNEIC